MEAWNEIGSGLIQTPKSRKSWNWWNDGEAEEGGEEERWRGMATRWKRNPLESNYTERGQCHRRLRRDSLGGKKPVSEWYHKQWLSNQDERLDRTRENCKNYTGRLVDRFQTLLDAAGITGPWNMDRIKGIKTSNNHHRTRSSILLLDFLHWTTLAKRSTLPFTVLSILLFACIFCVRREQQLCAIDSEKSII